MLNAQMTMAEAFHQVATSRRNQEAMICVEERLTYGQLLERVHSLACGLHNLGIGKGDKVIALLPAGPEFACLFFALAELGGVIVPLNPQLRPRTLGQILTDIDPLMLVSDHPLEADLLASAISLKHIIMTRDGEATFLSLRDIMSVASADQLAPAAVSPDDLLAILYTSGTTGIPKGTMHSHRTLITPVMASIKIRDCLLYTSPSPRDS